MSIIKRTCPSLTEGSLYDLTIFGRKKKRMSSFNRPTNVIFLNMSIDKRINQIERIDVDVLKKLMEKFSQ